MQPRNATRSNQYQLRCRAGIWRTSLGALLIGGLCGCAGTDRVAASPQRNARPSQTVQAWVTTVDRTEVLTRHDLALAATTAIGATTVAGATPTAEAVIDIDPTKRYQQMVGFGASITDASAWLIRVRMKGSLREALMQELFGPPPGLRISFIRLTIGASDFSRTHYSLDDPPNGQPDPELRHFSLTPIRETVLPVVRDALSLNRSLRVMASPWSAPGWMKSNGSLVKGTLLPQFYGAFAGYLVKYVDAMKAQGIPIFALTLQNEPHFEPNNYPGMRLDAQARAQLIGKYLGPALAGRRHATSILEWDHNWAWPEEPLQVLGDPQAAAYIAGVAWHCYKGHVAAQTPVHLAHPDKDAYLTECSGGGWEHPSDPALLSMARELIIGSARGWARGVLLWNLALDESAGPHLGGCTNCRGLVTIDSRTGEVTRNAEYYVIAHSSRFVQPGAERIESTETDSGLDNVAFRNPNDGSIVLIAANSATSPQALLVRCRGREFQFTMPAQSIGTFVWEQEDATGGNRSPQ